VGLVDRNPVDPGLQGALRSKASDIAEDLEEDLLHHVAGVGLIVQEPQGQHVNRLLEPADQVLVCALGPGPQTLDQTEIFDIRGSFRRPFRAKFQN